MTAYVSGLWHCVQSPSVLTHIDLSKWCLNFTNINQYNTHLSNILLFLNNKIDLCYEIIVIKTNDLKKLSGCIFSLSELVWTLHRENMMCKQWENIQPRHSLLLRLLHSIKLTVLNVLFCLVRHFIRNPPEFSQTSLVSMETSWSLLDKFVEFKQCFGSTKWICNDWPTGVLLPSLIIMRRVIHIKFSQLHCLTWRPRDYEHIWDWVSFQRGDVGNWRPTPNLLPLSSLLIFQ